MQTEDLEYQINLLNKNKTSSWFLFLAAALFFHLALLLSFPSSNDVNGALEKGYGGIEIGLMNLAPPKTEAREKKEIKKKEAISSQPNAISDIPDPTESVEQEEQDYSNENSHAGGGDAENDINYLRLLDNWIQKYRTYPMAARKRGMEGKVIVSFTINNSGAVIKSSIVESSGYLLLDRSAMRAIEKASPMPAVPADLQSSSGQYNYEVPFTFELTDKK